MELNYTIKLVSDGQTHTGLGGEAIDDYVARDHRGRPVVRATHIKGIVRTILEGVDADIGLGGDLADRVLGRPGVVQDDGPGDCGAAARFIITDAVCDEAPSVTTRTRTALDPETGTVRAMTLRTVEAVPAGTEFRGRVTLNGEPGDPLDVALRFGLLAMASVGSGTSRGGGSCVVSIDGEDRGPGELLKALRPPDPAPTCWSLADAAGADAGDTRVLLDLVFVAEGPLCCPETPVRTNVVQSGFAVAASAVQGALLHRLNGIDPALAGATFESDLFRAWPLLPCAPADADGTLPVPVRVSLTHRVAKLAIPGESKDYDSYDQAVKIEPYNWKEEDAANPLKASDGVLLRDSSGKVMLWKSANMPRVVTAHGVLHDAERAHGRNLYHVEAIAPLTWRGFVSLPSKAAERLLDSLEADPHIAFGRGRSVRGSGTLTAVRVDSPPACAGASGRPVLVAQSPLLLPNQDARGMPADQEFRELIGEWCRQHELPVPDAEAVWGVTGVRFGWSRHGSEERRAGLLQAQRVVLPGSVFRLSDGVDPERLTEALLAGVGAGRRRGFGAVSPHPGIASGLYAPGRSTRVANSSGLQSVTKRALDIARKAPSLSPSQVSAVQQRLHKSLAAAKGYLDQQRLRTERIWADWETVFDDFYELIAMPHGEHALKLLADILIVKRKGGNSR